MVADVLDNLKQRNAIADFKYAGTRQRHDFAVTLSQVDRRFAAIEVKGGEGNSINISERPLWADEFAVWCHLDGAIVNQPAHGAHAIVGRLTNEMVNRRKQVDVLFIKDLLCGTSTRPCPKYPGKEADMGLRTAPDVFLFPQRIPTVDDPKPPGHDVVTLALPALILDLFGVAPVHYADHVFEVRVAIVEQPSGRLARMTTVVHKGQEVDRGIGRFSAQR